MLTTLVLFATLGLPPNQGTELTLGNVRATYGIIGPKRVGKELLPGDSLYLTFDIEGITSDPEGKIRYSVSTEVKDSKGKVHFSQPGRDLEAIAALGGNRLPAYAQIDIGLEQPPGDYTAKLTVMDRASKKSKSLTGEFKVLPKAFGIVRLITSSDPDGIHAVGLPLGTGQSLWVNFAAVGFARASGKGQPNVAFTLRVLNEEGKPTLAKPFAGVVNKDVDPKAAALPVQFHLGLNRPGAFTIEVIAKDEISGKTSKQAFPIKVTEAK
jgi:hypothetical protein